MIDVEAISAWRRLAASGQLDEHRAERALSSLTALRMRRVPHRHLLDRCWELRHNVSSHDAPYVSLAEQLGAPLVTFDARLAAAPGLRCEIEVL